MTTSAMTKSIIWPESDTINDFPEVERRLNVIYYGFEKLSMDVHIIKQSVNRIENVQMIHGGKIDDIESHLKDHDDRFNKVDERFDKVEAHLRAHDERFDKVEAHLREHDERFDRIDERFDKLEENFEMLDFKLNTVIDLITNKLTLAK